MDNSGCVGDSPGRQFRGYRAGLVVELPKVSGGFVVGVRMGG